MKTTWRYKDLIDLEYFLREDETADTESARKNAARRDRRIYLRHIQPRLAPGEPGQRRWLLRQWVDRRRADLASGAAEGFLPGDAFSEAFRLLVTAAAAAGILAGGGLALSLLQYAGANPVNVSIYLSLLVAIQVLLIALFLAGALLRRLWRRKPPASVLASLLGALLVALVFRIRRSTASRLSGRTRASLEALAGILRGKQTVYGALLYWPFFMLAQVFGIGFNLGVLGATLLRVLGTDIAFGWQSSILFSAEAVYEAVKAIALPWSWFLPPDIAHPTLAQIEGSHMVLKDGIYHLATRDLVSWWPFLCLAVLFYGLIPRLLFLAAGWLFTARSLARLDFSDSRSDQLVQRMETPLLDVESEPPSERPRTEDAHAPAVRPAESAALSRGKALVALIPDDIFDACSRDELEALTGRIFGAGIQEALRMGEDPAGDRDLLARAGEAAEKNGSLDVFILKEAWQPPIREDLAFLRSLRETLGERSRIQMGLIGRPDPGTIFTPVQEKDWQIWQQKIASLGDPYLRLERLVIHDA